MRQLGVEQENIAQSRSRLQAALDDMERDVAAREELGSAREALRSSVEEKRAKHRQDKDAAHQLALRHQSTEAQLESTRQTMDRMAAQVQRF